MIKSSSSASIIKLGNNIPNFKFFIDKPSRDYDDLKINKAAAAVAKTRLTTSNLISSSSLSPSPTRSHHNDSLKSRYFTIRTRSTDQSASPQKYQRQVSNSLQKSDDNGNGMTKWRQERMWIEAIEREQKALKDWQEKWSFLADYDQKGNSKEKSALPDRVNMFSTSYPNSYGHVYGYRLDKDESKLITNLENQFSSNHRKQKTSAALLCYD